MPLLHEAITHQDGKTKNECEQNAAKRLIPDLKKSFPRLDMIIVEDALSGKVNLLEYWEVDENGKEKNFSWVSDIKLSRDNVYHVMRAGRSRRKIENETFNTLKNLGYNLEHNYGHEKNIFQPFLPHQPCWIF